MPKNKDDKPIKLEAFGRPFSMGSLYDARSSQLVPVMNPWTAESLENYVQIRETPYTELTIISGNLFGIKTKAFGIDCHVGLTFKCLPLSFEGSCHYLNHVSTTGSVETACLTSRVTTKFKYLDASAFKNIDLPHILRTAVATHVVTGIAYGADAHFVLETAMINDEFSNEIGGSLSMSFKVGPLALEGSASVDYKDINKDIIDSVSTTFYGDYLLDSYPTDYEAAMDLYKRLPDLLMEGSEGFGVAKTVWLYPLSKLDNAALRLLAEVSESLCLQATDILVALEDSRRLLGEVTKSPRLATFHPKLAKECLAAIGCIDCFIISMKAKLAEAIKKVKGSGKGESLLADIMQEYFLSPFTEATLRLWAKARQQEIKIVETYHESFQKYGFLTGMDPTSKRFRADQDIFIRGNLAIARNLANDLFIKACRECNEEKLKQMTRTMAKLEASNKPEWYKIPESRTEILVKLQSMMKYIKTNRGFEPTGYGRVIRIKVGIEVVDAVEPPPENDEEEEEDESATSEQPPVLNLIACVKGRLCVFQAPNKPLGLKIIQLDDRTVAYKIYAEFRVRKIGEQQTVRKSNWTKISYDQHHYIHLYFREVSDDMNEDDAKPKTLLPKVAPKVGKTSGKVGEKMGKEKTGKEKAPKQKTKEAKEIYVKSSAEKGWKKLGQGKIIPMLHSGSAIQDVTVNSKGAKHSAKVGAKGKEKAPSKNGKDAGKSITKEGKQPTKEVSSSTNEDDDDDGDEGEAEAVESKTGKVPKQSKTKSAKNSKSSRKKGGGSKRIGKQGKKGKRAAKKSGKATKRAKSVSALNSKGTQSRRRSSKMKSKSSKSAGRGKRTRSKRGKRGEVSAKSLGKLPKKETSKEDEVEDGTIVFRVNFTFTHHKDMPMFPGKYCAIRGFVENQLGRSEFSDPCLFLMKATGSGPQSIDLGGCVVIANKHSVLSKNEETQDVTVEVTKPNKEPLSTKWGYFNSPHQTVGSLPVALPDPTGGRSVIYRETIFDVKSPAPILLTAEEKFRSKIYNNGFIPKIKVEGEKLICLPRDSIVVMFNDGSSNKIPISALKVPFKRGCDKESIEAQEKDPYIVFTPKSYPPFGNTVMNAYPGVDGDMIQATVLTQDALHGVTIFYWVLGERAVPGSRKYRRAKEWFDRLRRMLRPGNPQFPLPYTVAILAPPGGGGKGQVRIIPALTVLKEGAEDAATKLAPK